jgi:hypothetical protein
MTEPIQTQTPSYTRNENCPAEDNPAVLFCCQCYVRLRDEALQDGKDLYDAKKAGRRAYKNAMPPLHGRENIRDFIACLTHAMLMDYFDGSDATRLLYAAQVALGSIEKPVSRPPGRPRTVSAETIPTEAPTEPEK